MEEVRSLYPVIGLCSYIGTVFRVEGSRKRMDPAFLPKRGMPCSSWHRRSLRAYLAHSVLKVVLHKSIPTQIRHFILYISSSKRSVDAFMGELLCSKRRERHFV